MDTVRFIDGIHGSETKFSYTLGQFFLRGCTTVIQIGDFLMYHAGLGGPAELACSEFRILRSERGFDG
ncbi:hypothetical protein [Corynebacterium provencense]|uniref:hypothetical protein n=1 Tax=Corynebacterium provencense TaxID=1737425 RepID=UPI000829925F|nr:hypothetical protein [Corynebacterium provencense]